MGREFNRRRVLSGIGVAGTLGLAGCIGDEGQIEEGGPDVLNIIGYPESGIQIFRDYYSEFGAGTADIIVPDGLLDDALPGEVGEDMGDVTGTAPSSAGPNEQAFDEMYQDEYGESAGVFNSHTFDAVAVMVLANIAAGDNDGEAIRDQVRNITNPDEGDEYGPDELQEAAEAVADGEPINYQGASSAVDFDDVGDPAEAAYDIWNFTEDGTETQDTINFEGEGPGGDAADEIPGGTDRDQVSVAILLPQTGDLGELGSLMIQAGELAAQEFQGAFEIDLRIEDTATDEDTTLSSAESLIDAGYPAIVGAASSGNSVPLSGLSSDSGIVQCSPASTALSLSEIDDDGYFFRTAPSDLLQGQVMADVAAGRLEAETTSTLYVNNDYGQQLSERYAEMFQDEQDGEVINQVSFEPEQGSYTSELESALAGD
ncbi:ABC transporter substrate-binding protein [Natronococcus wangiae]|uniref:ABC transporter substrate-binding protein n=1 Tax=Natronococcus wangiae TaxID=3068275 RepID=UPI00273DE790|nr:ABC transporter substrate-binding protein [Natronococcus sp. AD5]